MTTKIKVILVDDHLIIREGIANMLLEADDICLCGSAAGFQQAVWLASQHNPDVVITDLSMPGKTGIDLIRKLSESNPSARVLVLSMYVSEDYIFNALKAGAWGYLPKQDTTKSELFKAIRTISGGRQYFSDSIAQAITQFYARSAKKVPVPEQASKTHTLTSREAEIIRMYAEGLSNQEIAAKLSISVRTVEAHKNNIMQKFRFRSTVDMVKFAIRNNLVEL